MQSRPLCMLNFCTILGSCHAHFFCLSLKTRALMLLLWEFARRNTVKNHEHNFNCFIHLNFKSAKCRKVAGKSAENRASDVFTKRPRTCIDNGQWMGRNVFTLNCQLNFTEKFNRQKLNESCSCRQLLPSIHLFHAPLCFQPLRLNNKKHSTRLQLTGIERDKRVRRRAYGAETC